MALPGTKRVIALPGRGSLAVREVSAQGPIRSSHPKSTDTQNVLLLHGCGATADINYGSVYRTLASNWSLTAPDLRGHGGGISCKEDFSLEACADDIAALVRSLGIAPVMCVGYSMGGPVGMLMSIRHPDTVSGLVLCATSAQFIHNGPERFALQQLGNAARTFRKMRNLVLPTKLGPHVLQMAEALGAISRFNGSDWIGMIDVPTSVVITKQDKLVDAQNQYELARLISATEVFTIEGGHRSPITEARDFGKGLVDALLSVERRVSAPPQPQGKRRRATAKASRSASSSTSAESDGDVKSA